MSEQIIVYGSSDDTELERSGESSYSACHDATDAADYSPTEELTAGQWGSPNWNCYRAVMYFDTSAITEIGEIDSATLEITSTGGGTNTKTFVIQENITVSKPPVAGDYHYQHWSGDFGSESIDCSSTGVKTITFTSFGIINRTGITKIGLRSQDDIDGDTGANGDAFNFWGGLHSTSKPKLTINYTITAVSCDLGVTGGYVFDDLSIFCNMNCQADDAPTSAYGIGCSLDVSLSGGGVSADPFQESGEEGTDPFSWTPNDVDKAMFFVGNDVIGVSDQTYLDITRWVTPGWNINRTESGDIALDFTLANPEGKFTYSSSEDYIELKRDIPVLVAWGGNIYFYGIVDKPPADDTPDGSNIKVSCLGRQAILRYEDVTKRYLMSNWKTVEDVIEDIIYEDTSLNTYYGIVYDKPEPIDRHPLKRDFIFNNKDAHTCIKELTEYHNLLFYMDTDTAGADVVSLTRLVTANQSPKISTTLSEDNCLNFTKDRGSEVFYNRIKVIARTDDGDVLVAEQQDVASIRDEGLHVRPVEDIGSVQSQSELQAYAEYLLAKHSLSNYTTSIDLDPTKFTEEELWNLRPLDIVKVTHAKLELGTDEKYIVQEVTLSGDTDQLTGVEIVLNHQWRNAAIMRFEEQPTVYDRDQTVEDEELVHSRIMSATVNVYGCYDIYKNTSHNYYPSDQFTTDGFHGLNEYGRQLIKTNWLRDPEYGPGGTPVNPYTMRISQIWPLMANGWVYGKEYWHYGTDGFHNSYESGSPPQYSGIWFNQDIVVDSPMTVEGLLVCSRFGGKVTKITSDAGSVTDFYLDDPKYLRPGMQIYISSKNPQYGSYPDVDPETLANGIVYSIDYETGAVFTSINDILIHYDQATTYWYADCFPVAYVDYDTAVSFIATDTGTLTLKLRFYGDLDEYGEKNLSVVTTNGLDHMAKRMAYDIFNLDRFNGDSNALSWKPPINMAIGLNETTPRYEALQTHTDLIDEIARSTDITAGNEFVSSASESAKVTAKFRSNIVTPRVTEGLLTYAASSGAQSIYLSNIDGLLVGDAIYFGTSGTGEWQFSETVLSPDYVKEIFGHVGAPYNGYKVYLRHGLNEAKTAGTAWSTGKIIDSEVSTIAEFGLYDEPVIEVTDESYYLGKRTGSVTYPSDVMLQNGDDAMGYGDFQYDNLQTEDSLSKSSDTPPSYFSKEVTETTDYLIDVTGIGYSTIPLLGMMQGGIDKEITFTTDDFYGRSVGIDQLWKTFKNISNPMSAMNISPIARVSTIEQENKGATLFKEFRPSKWRAFKRAGRLETRDESEWCYRDEFVLYSNKFAAQLFSFAVDGDIKRQDLKEINLTWRGAAKSFSDGKYWDGVNFYIWHWGDHQPAYAKDDNTGLYSVSGRVGDVKTFYEHWEAIEMVEGNGSEHNEEIPSGFDYNPLFTLRSKVNGGADDTTGVNKIGYCLSEDNKIWILAVAKYISVTTEKKISKITTDFVGLSIGTSSIFDNQTKTFKKGIDYLHNDKWKFVAWPSLDYTWDTNDVTYHSRYNLTEVATLTIHPPVASTTLYTTGSDWFTPGAILLLASDTDDQQEIVQIAQNSRDTFNPALTAPLLYNWVSGTKVYVHIANTAEFPIQVLGKAIIPDFPTRGFLRTTIGTYAGYSGVLTAETYKGWTQSTISNTAGFKSGDTVMFWRSPGIATISACGFEYHTIPNDPVDSTHLPHDAIIREDMDNDSSAFDEGSDPNFKTSIGVVRFSVPLLETGMTLGWLIANGTWEDGDAVSSKWRLPNPSWGLVQFPNIEASITGSDVLSSTETPDYTGWSSYGGSGVKIENYDETNKTVTVTKAKDITLYDGNSSSNTDDAGHITNYVFYGLTVDCRWNTPPNRLDFNTVAGTGVQLGRSYDAYGNRSSADTPIQRITKVVRNSYIYLRNQESASGHTHIYQFALAESIDADGAVADPVRVRPRYRCLHARSGTYPNYEYDTTLRSTNDNSPEQYWYLDAPMFDQSESEYSYIDLFRGNVSFILDCVIEEHAAHTDSPDAGNPITRGDETFTLTGQGGNFEVNDLVLFHDADYSKCEIVQVVSKDGSNITICPPFANSYAAGDTIAWEFTDYCVRAHFTAVQVYGPIESGETLNISTNVYRPAKYTATWAKKTGNLLVYSILKDHSVYRPVKSDMADTLQFIQEVKFKYYEKDMV